MTFLRLKREISFSINTFRNRFNSSKIITKSSYLKETKSLKSFLKSAYFTAQKMKFSIKDFSSKCDQIHSKKIHKKALEMESFARENCNFTKTKSIVGVFVNILEHAFYRTPSGDRLEIVVNSFCLQEANSRQRPSLFNKWRILWEKISGEKSWKTTYRVHYTFYTLTFVPWLFPVAGCKLAAK